MWSMNPVRGKSTSAVVNGEDGRHVSEVVVVTGSSSGIGRAVAERFAADGARVIVNSSRSVEEGETLARSLPQAEYVQGDVSHEEDARRLVATALERFGRLDAVVNNAGTTGRVPFADLEGADDELWSRILGVNLMGPWYLSRAVAPVLRETKGAIVNVGSVAGIIAGGSSLPYAVSKAALHHLTRTLAQALAPDVRVNAVAPGLVETPWTEGWEANDAIVARTPLGRAATPEDIADVVVSLARTPFATGQVVVVDGGLTLT
jgi:ketoreductase RED2